MIEKVGFFIAGVVLASILALLFRSSRRKPPNFDSLHRGLDTLIKGDYTHRFTIHPDDPLASPKEKVNVLARELERQLGLAAPLPPASHSDNKPAADAAAPHDWRQEYLVKAEVQRSLGDIISGLAHEINNPLTGIFGYIDLLLIRDSIAPMVKDKLVQIQQQAMRIKGIIEKLHQLDPDSSHTKYEIDLVNLLDKMIKVYSSRHENRDLVFERRFSDDSLLVYGNHFFLWQAFDNIIENSIEAITENEVKNGRISIDLRKSPDGQYAIAEVQDNGGGFKDIGKAFDPFYTTKSRSQNKGIGLTIVFNIIKEHLGSILVSNNENNGATVSVFLPLMGGFRTENT